MNNENQYLSGILSEGLDHTCEIHTSMSTRKRNIFLNFLVLALILITLVSLVGTRGVK